MHWRARLFLISLGARTIWCAWRRKLGVVAVSAQRADCTYLARCFLPPLSATTPVVSSCAAGNNNKLSFAQGRPHTHTQQLLCAHSCNLEKLSRERRARLIAATAADSEMNGSSDLTWSSYCCHSRKWEKWMAMRNIECLIISINSWIRLRGLWFSNVGRVVCDNGFYCWAVRYFN
jgi:hypothetical protein